MAEPKFITGVAPTVGPLTTETVPETFIEETALEEPTGEAIKAQVKEKVGKVSIGERPDKEEFDRLEEEKRELAKKEVAEKEEIQKEVKEVPVTEEEQREQQARKFIQMLKTDSDLDAAKAEYIQNKIRSNLKLKQALDPTQDPMVSFDERQKLANENLRAAFKEGAALLEGAKPQMPELQDDDINANQAAITLAIQSLTGIMGSVTGRDVGLRAASEAGAAGMDAIVKNIESRQKANAGLTKAYNQSLSKHGAATQKFVNEYMKQVGQNGRKAIEEYVDHWKNVQDIAIDRRQARLEEAKTAIERAKVAGKISSEKFKAQNEAINFENANLEVYGKLLNAWQKNKTTAEKANQTAAMQFLEQSQKRINKKGIKLNLAKGRSSFLNLTPTIMRDIEVGTTTPNGLNQYYRGTGRNASFSNGLNGLNTVYSTQELISDQGKMTESINIETGLENLLTFMETTRKVPVVFDLKAFGRFATAYAEGKVTFTKPKGLSLRDASDVMDLRVAQALVAQKINILAANRDRAQKALDIRLERFETGESKQEQKIRAFFAARNRSEKFIQERIEKFRKTKELPKGVR